jgi:hypothetical protein
MKNIALFSLIIALIFTFLFYNFFKQKPQVTDTPVNTVTTAPLPSTTNKSITINSRSAAAAKPAKAENYTSAHESIKNLFNSKSTNKKWYIQVTGNEGFTLSDGQIQIKDDAELFDLAQTVGEALGITPEQIQVSTKTISETNISRVKIFNQTINDFEVRGSELRFFISKKKNAIFYVTSTLFPIEEYNLNQNYDYAKLMERLNLLFLAPQWQILASNKRAFLWPSPNHKAEIAYQFVVRNSRPFEEREIIMSALSGEILWNKNRTIRN